MDNDNELLTIGELILTARENLDGAYGAIELRSFDRHMAMAADAITRTIASLRRCNPASSTPDEWRASREMVLSCLHEIELLKGSCAPLDSVRAWIVDTSKARAG